MRPRKEKGPVCTLVKIGKVGGGRERDSVGETRKEGKLKEFEKKLCIGRKETG